ncbi:hypothetical protein P0L94_04795 [Microbacter sp. GSS18]|nr:hypothetical protein P0L94_04795 [Microbacter sp. GSS18]
MADQDHPASPYRTLRHVAGGRESPYAGVLAQHDAQEPCLLVDAEALGADWAGWRADPEGHVVAPVDVVRRSGGHDVVLRLCRERVDRFLDRRESAHRPISAGEAVTLGVSAMRGLAELDEGGRRSAAQWWLTADGRPILAPGAGDEAATDAVCALLTRIAPASAADAWAHAIRVAGGERVSTRALEEAEAVLFAAAAPRPLTTDLREPRTARSLAVDARADAGGAGQAPDGEPGWIARAARSVDADVADIASRVTTAFWRAGRREPRRGRVWLAAAAAGAAVVAGGLLWPQPGEEPGWAAGGATAAVRETPGVSAAPTASAPSPTPGPETDLATIVGLLLDARIDCAGDPVCLGEVQSDGLREFAPWALDLSGSQRHVALLDDLGDVAVAEVGGAGGREGTQIVVIARQNGRWLLRDVYDVAQQPSEG